MRTYLLLLCTLLSLAACSRNSSTYSSKDGSVTVEKKGGEASSMTFTGKDGQKMTMDLNGGSVPANYPSDVPVYKGAKVIVSQVISEKNTIHLMLESTDDAAKIAEFYKKGLDSNGWKTEATLATGEMNMINATKDKRQVTVQIVNNNDKRSITQITSDKS